jgi:hypothetical protein
MGSIRITAFGGIKPRLMRGNSGPTSASEARDVKLWHGYLAPWRYPAKAIETGKDKLCSIFSYKCCFIGSENECADFTMGDVNCPRVFSTGHMPWPAYADLGECEANCATGDCCGTFVEPTWCRLGVPAPVNAPTITNVTVTEPQGDCTNCDFSVQRKRENRAYFYTFVNAYGEESFHSPISAIVDADINSPATLGFVIPPVADGYCEPVSIRIYRAGSSSGVDDESFGDADFFLVDEIDYADGMFTHVEDTPADCIGEVYPENCVNQPPPANLENINALENGVLVGSVNNKLWFSEPWKFHSWTCFMELDDCIKAIKVGGGQIYVATNGRPYIVDQESRSDDEDCLCCRAITRLAEPAPLLCKRSMVTTGTGVMWATDMGLAKLMGSEFRIDTHDFMAEDDWQKWYPHDLKGVYYKGEYFGFNAERGFIWATLTGAYSETYPGDNAKFSTLSLTPTAVWKTDQNILYMVFDGDIYRWDSSDTYIPYRWRSRLNIEGGLQNYSAAKVVFEKYLRTKRSPHPVHFRLYADDKLMFERKITCGKPFRLPKGYDGLNWEIELTGIEQINEVHMATSMPELVLLNNA